MTRRLLAAAIGLSALVVAAPGAAIVQEPTGNLLLLPDRVFDGERVHESWAVVVAGEDQLLLLG